MISRLVVVAALAGVANADPLVEQLGKYWSADFHAPDALKPPRLVLDFKNRASPTWPDVQYRERVPTIHTNQLAGTTSDKTATWLASELSWTYPCDPDPADPFPGMSDPKPCESYGHALGLLDADRHPVAWVISPYFTPKEAAAIKKLRPMPDGIDPGAEIVAKLVQLALPDPKVLAKLVSERPDAVMFGSEAGERFIGGAAIKKALGLWKLAFVVHDGTQATLSASKTAAVVALNVDANRVGTKLVAPYRLFVILEKSATGWQVVALSFDLLPA